VIRCKNLPVWVLYKITKVNVPINNIQLAKRQVKQVSFIHSSECQQELPNFVYRAADCSRCAPLQQRTVGRQVWYVELTAIAASVCQQNADDNGQQRWWTDVQGGPKT